MAKAERVFALLVRFVAFGASLAAAIVMATSHETNTVFGIAFEAKYTDSPAFKYFVITNSIVAVYSFLLLFLPSNSLFWRFFVVLDFMITILLVSSISTTLTIAQIGKKGNSHTGWIPICGQVPNYCDKVTGAIVTSFIGVLMYLIIDIYFVHNVANPIIV